MTKRERLITEAQENIKGKIEKGRGIPINYLIFNDPIRDGIVVRLKALIFEEEFIPAYKFAGG